MGQRLRLFVGAEAELLSAGFTASLFNFVTRLPHIYIFAISFVIITKFPTSSPTGCIHYHHRGPLFTVVTSLPSSPSSPASPLHHRHQPPFFTIVTSLPSSPSSPASPLHHRHQPPLFTVVTSLPSSPSSPASLLHHRHQPPLFTIVTSLHHQAPHLTRLSPSSHLSPLDFPLPIITSSLGTPRVYSLFLYAVSKYIRYSLTAQ